MPNYSVFNLNEEQLKTLNYGLDITGTNAVPISTDQFGNLNVRSSFSAFGEVIALGKTSLIRLKSVYGLSVLRDVVATTNSGTVTNNGTEYLVSTAAVANSTATLDSAARGRYLPGFAGEAGIAVRLPTAPTGTQDVSWGYFDNDNGAYFGQDSTGIYIAIRRGGSTTKVYQSSWNHDKMDGTGPSGYTLDLSIGYIFQILYTWYGYGVINYRIVIFDENDIQNTITVHKYRPENQTSFTDPNLPIRAQAINGASTASAFTMYVAGRQYSVYGEYVPNNRITSERRLTQSVGAGSYTPTVSFRRKTNFPIVGRVNSVSVKLEGVDIIASTDCIIQVRLNSTLTGASFGTPTDTTASETSVESDISATALTGGQLIYEGLVNGGTFFSVALTTVDLLNLDFVGTQPVTIGIRTLTGTGTVSVAFRVREDW